MDVILNEFHIFHKHFQVLSYRGGDLRDNGQCSMCGTPSKNMPRTLMHIAYIIFVFRACKYVFKFDFRVVKIERRQTTGSIVIRCTCAAYRFKNERGLIITKYQLAIRTDSSNSILIRYSVVFWGRSFSNHLNNWIGGHFKNDIKSRSISLGPRYN